MRDGLVRLAKANHYVATYQRQLCAPMSAAEANLCLRPEADIGVASWEVAVAP